MSLNEFLGVNQKFLKAPTKAKVPRVRKGKRDTRINLCADFETENSPDAEKTHVWSWGYVSVDKPAPEFVKVGHDLDSFMVEMSKVNSTCYFHNLKFDGEFMVYWLLTRGYTHVTDEILGEIGTFKTLISDAGKWFSITVKWKSGFNTEFRDSLKKLPFGIRRIAQAFNLEISKGDIDYEAPRPVGYMMTKEEEDYLRRDVSILGQAMKQVLDSGMTRLTVASDSMAEYKRINSAAFFQAMFPIFSYEMDREIRMAYRGGWTYADPRFQGQLQGAGLVLDVNSLYPYVMRHRSIPYGMPEFVDGRCEPTLKYPLVIFSVCITAKLKEGHVPCIQIKRSNFFIETEYVSVIKEPTMLYVTNVDWELYNEHYNIKVMYRDEGWRFKATEGLFDSYIDKWAAVKASETGGKKEIAKLHLNSLYGKFATNPNVTSKIPILENGLVKLIRGEAEIRPPIYTPAGIFITAYARDITIRAAQANYGTFAYADTDSLHLLQTHIPDSIEVHPSQLGAWKLEYEFSQAYYIRAKAYLELKLSGIYENHIAGLPLRICEDLTFDDLIDGKVIHGKLAPRRVPGGVVLKDVPFRLKLGD